MFERGKKDDDTIESQESNYTDSGKTFGSLRSKVTGTVELKNTAPNIGQEGRIKAGVYASMRATVV